MRKLGFLKPIGLLAVPVIFGIIVMLLWNWLMPSMFGFVTVSFWQALGILVLCRILFGSLGGLHHGTRHAHDRFHLREKWQKMTPEERKEFVKRQREHFGKSGFFGRHGFDPFATDENMPKEHE